MAWSSAKCGRYTAARLFLLAALLGLCACWFSSFSARAGDTWVSLGSGAGAEGFYGYGGATYAPFGGLGEEGLRARLWSKTYRYSYGRAVSPSRTAKIDVTGVGLEAEVGWQFSGADWRLAAYAGGAWRDHELSRPDPAASPPDGGFGPSFAMNGSYQLGEHWRVSADARYTAGFNELWVQVRPEFGSTGAMKLGLASSFSRGDDYLIVRAGGSIANLRYKPPTMDDLYLSAEAGFEVNVDTNKSGPYAAIHVGFAY